MDNKNISTGLTDNKNAESINQQPTAGKAYHVKVDNENVSFTKDLVPGREILMEAGKQPVECFTLYLKQKGQDFIKIPLDDVVDLAKPGLEHFITKSPDAFYYDLDDEAFSTTLKEMTPNQILAAGQININTHYLILIKNGEQISYKDNGDQPIQMICPRMKFISILNGPMPVS